MDSTCAPQRIRRLAPFLAHCTQALPFFQIQRFSGTICADTLQRLRTLSLLYGSVHYSRIDRNSFGF